MPATTPDNTPYSLNDLSRFLPPEDGVGSALDLTLFVACYNEEENLADTLDTLLAALAEVDLSYEVIVIDDCSSDGSVRIACEYIDAHPEATLYLKTYETNQGLAQNFINGAFLGRGEYYRLICGDNVEPKETFVALFKCIGEADMIIPHQVQCPGRSQFRVGLSRIYTRLINLISGYQLNYYNGLTIHKRYDVMRWHTNYHGFGFQADMITRLLDVGASYVEVPVTARERQAGGSKALTFSNICSVGHFLLDLSIRRVGRSLFNRRG